MIVLYFSKIVWITIFFVESYKLLSNIRKIYEPTIKFDLVSIFEISTNFGLSLVLLGSKYTNASFIFVSISLFFLAGITVFEFRRIVVLGSDELIVRNRIVNKHEIKGYRVVYTVLYLYTDDDVIKVMTPLSDRSSMNNLVKNIKKVS